MILFVLISFIVFAAYTLVCMYRYGIPLSLSETYYLLKEDSKCPVWFTACLGIADLSLLFAWLHISDIALPNITFLTFICFVAILFVAVAPNFKDIQRWVHTISAIIGGLSAVVWCVFAYWYIPAIFIVLAAIASIKKISSVVFWFEMAAFLSVYASVIILYLTV